MHKFDVDNKSEHGNSKFNEKVKDKILELAQKGKTDKEIADIIGVHVNTIGNWKGRYPDFMWALKESKGVADDLVEASLFHRAVGYSHKAQKFFQHEGCILSEEYIEHYPPDTTAAIFWLKNRRPKEWREKQEIQHSGAITVADFMAQAAAKEENE